MKNSLVIQNLTFAYAEDEPNIFQNFDFELPIQNFNLLVGPSGSGKSTIFKLIAGLYPQYRGIKRDGKILLNGQEVSEVVPFERAQHVSMLFQNPTRQFAMKTTFEQIVFVLENIQYPENKIIPKVNEILETMHLNAFKDRNLQTLSGGEQQRVALAMTLALDSPIILLDEPFANIDSKSRIELLHELKILQKDHGKTIFISDHDISNYDGLVNHVYQMNVEKKKIVELSLSFLKDTLLEQHFAQNILSSSQIFRWNHLGFKSGDRTLLNDSSLFLPQGQIGLLSGDNGIGKSTFFAALSHQKKYTGSILFKDNPSEKVRLGKWAKIVANIFQNSSDQFIRLHAHEELELSARHSLRSDYWNDNRIKKAISHLNLTDVLNHVSYQLSGGQQKKLQALAVLIMSQPIMLFDEPFAGLDIDSVESLMDIITETTADLELTSLIISHQRKGIDNRVNYELIMADQKIRRQKEF